MNIDYFWRALLPQVVGISSYKSPRGCEQDQEARATEAMQKMSASIEKVMAFNGCEVTS